MSVESLLHTLGRIAESSEDRAVAEEAGQAIQKFWDDARAVPGENVIMGSGGGAVEYPIRAGDRYSFTGEQLVQVLQEAGGAVSSVFMANDPELVMPAEDVLQALVDWAEASGLQLATAYLGGQMPEPRAILVEMPADAPLTREAVLEELTGGGEVVLANLDKIATADMVLGRWGRERGNTTQTVVLLAKDRGGGDRAVVVERF